MSKYVLKFKCLGLKPYCGHIRECEYTPNTSQPSDLRHQLLALGIRTFFLDSLHAFMHVVSAKDNFCRLAALNIFSPPSRCYSALTFPDYSLTTPLQFSASKSNHSALRFEGMLNGLFERTGLFCALRTYVLLARNIFTAHGKRKVRKQKQEYLHNMRKKRGMDRSSESETKEMGAVCTAHLQIKGV